MLIASKVLAVLFGLLCILSGTGKLRRDPKIVEGVHGKLGVPLAFFPVLGGLLVAGGLGLFAVFFYPPLALAAASGLVLYFMGAIGSHLRVGDTAGLMPSVVLLAVAAATLATQVLAH